MNKPEFKQWAKKFFAAKQQPMDQETSKLFATLTLMEKITQQEVPDELKGSFSYRVVQSRAQHLKADFSPHACAFVALLAGSPGEAVMYVSALASLGEKITLERLAHVFPMGFPSEEDLSKLWDAQKGDYPLGNMLDAITAIDCAAVTS